MGYGYSFDFGIHFRRLMTPRPIWLEGGAKRLPRGKEFATRQSQRKLMYIILHIILRSIVFYNAFCFGFMYVFRHAGFICLV